MFPMVPITIVDYLSLAAANPFRALPVVVKLIRVFGSIASSELNPPNWAVLVFKGLSNVEAARGFGVWIGRYGVLFR